MKGNPPNDTLPSSATGQEGNVSLGGFPFIPGLYR